MKAGLGFLCGFLSVLLRQLGEEERHGRPWTLLPVEAADAHPYARGCAADEDEQGPECRSSALTTCSSSPRSEKRRRREAGRGAPFSTNKPSGRASHFGVRFPRWHSSLQVLWISSKSSVASVSFSLRVSNEHSLSELCAQHRVTCNGGWES